MRPADILFPPRCAFCDSLLPPDRDGVCGRCERELPFVEPERRLRPVGKHTCAVTVYYEKAVPSGVYGFKFSARAGRARVFARYMAETVSELFAGEFDAVTYVPVSPQRRLVRGFDQSYLLAKHCCRLWNIKPVRTLVKIRNNPPQSTVKTERARRKNVQDVFRVSSRTAVVGRRFLLIDDITTSGSTMERCADLLLEAGAASVVCAAFAGARRDTFL